MDVEVCHPHAAHTPKWCPLPIGDRHVEEIWGERRSVFLGGGRRGEEVKEKRHVKWLGEGQALTPPQTVQREFVFLTPPKPRISPHKNQPHTRISTTQESAPHKNQLHTRISTTPESDLHKKPCSRVKNKKTRVASKAPPWHRRCHPRAERAP